MLFLFRIKKNNCVPQLDKLNYCQKTGDCTYRLFFILFLFFFCE